MSTGHYWFSVTVCGKDDNTKPWKYVLHMGINCSATVLNVFMCSTFLTCKSFMNAVFMHNKEIYRQKENHGSFPFFQATINMQLLCKRSLNPQFTLIPIF